jgi:dolichyl-diphosphooligosaccharide--protein glycosyltransferase
MSVIPSYISRSAAGSYDNEAVAIFALVFSFYTFMKAANTGSMLWSCFAAFAFFYMVSCWGGYAFIINIIPIFMISMIVIGKLDHQLYTCYSIFYLLGTLLALQIPFVGF